jgi:hypothetical protein
VSRIGPGCLVALDRHEARSRGTAGGFCEVAAREPAGLEEISKVGVDR